MKIIEDKFIKVRFPKPKKPVRALITRRYMTDRSTQWIERASLSAHIFRLSGEGKLYYLAMDDGIVLSKGIFILHPPGPDRGDFTAAIYGSRYLFGITKKAYENIEVGDGYDVTPA
jgi:hypothetical protein